MAKSKDFNYFKAFIDLSNGSLKAAELLSTTLYNFDVNKIVEKVKEMHTVEHNADLERHEIMNRLTKEFLPPIEREDIISLADNVDDVIDSIEDVLIGIDMYNIRTIRPEIIRFIEVIMDCCKSMSAALTEFEHFKRSHTLHAAIIEVNRLEEVADELYINGVRNLYRNTKDPVELMVWTEIYRLLEKCCDSCEEVANDIENIVMKNS
jgi:predicted phosphate transport protein (TIGR00153 family)